MLSKEMLPDVRVSTLLLNSLVNIIVTYSEQLFATLSSFTTLICNCALSYSQQEDRLVASEKEERLNDNRQSKQKK